MAKAELATALGLEQVDLVEGEELRTLARADVGKRALDGADHLLYLLVRRCAVDDVNDQVRAQRLLERRPKRLDELVGQLADEADRVGQQVGAPSDLECARRRVERVKEPVADAGARAGQSVEEGRLARVRVPRESHRRQVSALALAAHGGAGGARVLEPAAQRGNAVAREAAVGLDLGLTGATCADAAVHASGAEALEVGPQPPHAGEVVLELGELDLELALGGAGVVG